MKLFLLTGPIQSGKTTALQQTFGGRSDVGGFLSPVVEGKRHFQSLSKPLFIPMEAPDSEEDVLAVGRFRFCQKSFIEAENWFWQEVNGRSKSLMILDEAGPLELSGNGFAYLISTYLNQPKPPDLLVVVRENLVQRFLNRWNLGDRQWQIITISELDQPAENREPLPH